METKTWKLENLAGTAKYESFQKKTFLRKLAIVGLQQQNTNKFGCISFHPNLPSPGTTVLPCSPSHSVLQTQLQNGSLLFFSYISFSSFTFPGAPYWILLVYLPRLPYHFYLVILAENHSSWCEGKIPTFLSYHQTKTVNTKQWIEIVYQSNEYK